MYLLKREIKNKNYSHYSEYLARLTIAKEILWKEWNNVTMCSYDTKPPEDILNKNELDKKFYEVLGGISELSNSLEAAIRWCELGEEGYREFVWKKNTYIDCPTCHGNGYLGSDLVGEEGYICDECCGEGEVLLAELTDKEFEKYKEGLKNEKK
jgi:hypothetical protein